MTRSVLAWAPCANSDLPRPVRSRGRRPVRGPLPVHQPVSDASISAGYVDAIVQHCEGLAAFPHRGQSREDLRAGLRTVSYRKRVVIAFSVDETIKQVTILGVFYGGQDYESSLSEPDE